MKRIQGLQRVTISFLVSTNINSFTKQTGFSHLDAQRRYRNWWGFGSKWWFICSAAASSVVSVAPLVDWEIVDTDWEKMSVSNATHWTSADAAGRGGKEGKTMDGSSAMTEWVR
jgi:hypothetical protein